MHLVELPAVLDHRGTLTPFSDIPFTIRRMFWLGDVVRPTRRGGHAHRTTAQFLIGLAGETVVHAGGEVFELGRAGLLVPPLTWLDIDMAPGSMVLVLCPEAFDESDYIRDRAEFDAL